MWREKRKSVEAEKGSRDGQNDAGRLLGGLEGEQDGTGRQLSR